MDQRICPKQNQNYQLMFEPFQQKEQQNRQQDSLVQQIYPLLSICVKHQLLDQPLKNIGQYIRTHSYVCNSATRVGICQQINQIKDIIAQAPQKYIIGTEKSQKYFMRIQLITEIQKCIKQINEYLIETQKWSQQMKMASIIWGCFLLMNQYQIYCKESRKYLSNINTLKNVIARNCTLIGFKIPYEKHKLQESQLQYKQFVDYKQTINKNLDQITKCCKPHNHIKGKQPFRAVHFTFNNCNQCNSIIKVINGPFNQETPHSKIMSSCINIIQHNLLQAIRGQCSFPQQMNTPFSLKKEGEQVKVRIDYILLQQYTKYIYGAFIKKVDNKYSDDEQESKQIKKLLKVILIKRLPFINLCVGDAYCLQISPINKTKNVYLRMGQLPSQYRMNNIKLTNKRSRIKNGITAILDLKYYQIIQDNSTKQLSSKQSDKDDDIKKPMGLTNRIQKDARIYAINFSKQFIQKLIMPMIGHIISFKAIQSLYLNQSCKIQKSQ